MSGLVYFTDEILYVCSVKDIFFHPQVCSAKYKDRKKYEARMLALSNNIQVLKKLLQVLERSAKEPGLYLCCDTSSIADYMTALKEVTKEQDHDVTFIDEIVFPAAVHNVGRFPFIMERVHEDFEFFDNQQQFLQFRTMKENELGVIEDRDNIHPNETPSFMFNASIQGSSTPFNTSAAEGTVSPTIDDDINNNSPEKLEKSNVNGEMESSNIPKPGKKERTPSSASHVDVPTGSAFLTGAPAEPPDLCTPGKKEHNPTTGFLQDNGGTLTDPPSPAIPPLRGSNTDGEEKEQVSVGGEEKIEKKPACKRTLFTDSWYENAVRDMVESGADSSDKMNISNNKLADDEMENSDVYTPRKEENTRTSASRSTTPSNSAEEKKDDATLDFCPEISVNPAETKENTPTTTSLAETPMGSTNSVGSPIKLTAMRGTIPDRACPASSPLKGIPAKAHAKPRKVDDKMVNISAVTKLLKMKKRRQIEVATQLADESTLHSESESKNKIENSSESEEGTTGSDEDYEPEKEEAAESDSDDTSSEIEELQEGESVNEKKQDKSLNITLGSNKHLSAPDDRNLLVDGVSKKTKKHFCLYCQKFQSKLARHLMLCHSAEDEVKKFIYLPPKNKERQHIIASIRKKGDHVYNTDRRFNEGTLIVCRRPSKQMKKTAEDFISCGNCKGQYTRAVYRHHWRKCTNRSNKTERIALIKGRKVAGRLHERASADTRKYIFPYLREDNVVRAIRYDELAILYANRMCEKYGMHPHHYKMIRQKLRLMGRFFLAIKECDKRIVHLSDVFQPCFYEATINAVRMVGGLDPETKIFAHAATAFDVGSTLKKFGGILRTEYIKKELDKDQKKVEDFLKLMSEDFTITVNRVVTETQIQNNCRKETVLPTTGDIKKLHMYVQAQRDMNFTKLSEGFSLEAWKELGKWTLLSLQIFNRRRPGELERLEVGDFERQTGLDMERDKEIYNSLSEEGRKLARKYVRCEIRGKLGRTVPVLLDTELANCMNLLVKHRRDAQIPIKNKYLFALPSADKDRNRHHSACEYMRDVALKCGAEFPETLRGTTLRKHIATKCIELNLSSHQVTDLANFMGHAEKIHKEIYRQPVLQTDIVKISQLLKKAQGDDDEDIDEDHVQEQSASTSRINEGASTSRGGDIDRSNNTSSRFSRWSDRSTASNYEVSTPRRWTDEQRNCVLSAFQKHFSQGKAPTGKEMENLIVENSVLNGRTVAQLRTWVHTQMKKKSKP